MIETTGFNLALIEQAANPFSHPDTLEKIVPWCDLRTVGALFCVSHSLRQDVGGCLPPEITFKLCGDRLRVIDTGAAKTPLLNPLELIEKCRRLAPFVKGDAGLTYLIMRKGLTLRQLVTIAKEKGMTVAVWDQHLEALGDISIGEDDGVLITNNVFKKSRKISRADQEALVHGLGCEIPSVQEYVALCVFTQQMFGKCLYAGKFFKEFACSSTPVLFGTRFLVVGACSCPHFDLQVSDVMRNIESSGVGGCSRSSRPVNLSLQ
jgi:hypothetical protein